MTGRVRRLTPEQKRKRRAALLSLATTAFLALVFVLLVWTPTPPAPQATGYLLLELGEGAPLAGKEVPARAPEPAPEAPPLAQAPSEPEAPAEPSPPPEPETTPEPEMPPEAAQASAAPPEASVPEAEGPEPETAPEPIAEAPAPQPGAPPPEEAARPAPLPEASPALEAENPTPEPAPPLEAEAAPPSSEPEPVAPALEPVPAEPAPAQAGPPTAPTATPAPPPQTAPSEPPQAASDLAPAAPASAASTPARPVPPAPAPSPGAPAPPAPAPAPPAFAPAPPAPAPPLAGGEPAPAPTPATSPQTGPRQGGAVGPGEKPYELVRLRPILVSVDNSAAAFPQWGLTWAVQVHEVPVEGGVTRLLVRYEGGEKGRLGPVRSARPYILRLAQAMGAVLLHVGGSPEALAMIEREKLVTFDGLYDPLFQRDPERRPPHNTFVEGPRVRTQLARLRLERKRTLRGKAYRPPEDAPSGERVEVRYAPDYVSAFRYDGQGYVWYRNGRLVRGSGAVRVTAVVVLRVGAQVTDAEGRLALDLSKGHGALHIEGRRIPLVWRVQGGLVLEDADGRPLDLTPYRTWFLWVPPWATLR